MNASIIAGQFEGSLAGAMPDIRNHCKRGILFLAGEMLARPWRRRPAAPVILVGLNAYEAPDGKVAG